MDIVSSFISVDSFEVHHVSDNVVLVYDSVSSKHVSGNSRYLEGLLAVVALDD